MQQPTNFIAKAKRRIRLAGFYLATITVGMIMAIMAGELLVRIVVPSEQLWAVGQSNIYQAVGASGIGYTYKPDLDRMAFGVDLKTNSLGFHGPEWPLEKTAETFRVVLIGDSHAFGFGVSYADSVGQVLAGILESAIKRNVEVLNFGVNGYNSRQESAVLQEYGLRFNPDLVVLMISGNDHEAARWVDDDGWMYRQRPSTGGWVRTFDKTVDAAEPGEFPRWLRHSHLALYLGIVRQQIRDQTGQAGEDNRNNSATAGKWPPQVAGTDISDALEASVYLPVLEMIRTSKAHNIPTVLGYYATDADYLRMINRLKSEEGIAAVDLLSLFPEVNSIQELTAKFSLGWDPHLNSEAHRRWANAFANVLEDHGYLPVIERQ